MPIPVHINNTFANDYTITDILKAWETDGQGHKQAVARGQFCIIGFCQSKYTAARISQAFANGLFAIPTCTHYDGITISLYCGDAGIGGYKILMQNSRALLRAHNVDPIDLS